MSQSPVPSLEEKMDRVTYFENEARMIIMTKNKTYRYKDVPFCIYTKMKILLAKNAIGKAWQLIKKYDLECI